MAKPYKLRKPVLGIDQLSDETALISDREKGISSLREATNVDIDNDGHVSRRKGYSQKLSGSGYHSLFETKRGLLMACHKDEIGVYDPPSNTFTVLANMAEAYFTSFAELNGNIYFVNPGDKGMIKKGTTTVKTIGVPLPNATPGFAPGSNGNLVAGRYGVSYTLVDADGEESPLGPLVVVTLPNRGSIVGTMFSTFAGHTYRIYMTTADGTELYQADEFDANVASYTIRDHYEGRQPETQYLSQLPFGYTIRAHGSRLYVATSDFVFYSEAFQPHLTNAAHNFLPIVGFPTMLQPIDTGIFVGDSTGVKFYRGEDPATFEPKEVSTEPVVFNTAVAVPGEFLPRELGSSGVSAIWLAPSGYQVGLPSGDVVRLHTNQVQLPKYVQGCAAVSVRDGRKQLITPVNSNVLADVSVALDSSTS